jgi:hypothetical protein
MHFGSKCKYFHNSLTLHIYIERESAAMVLRETQNLPVLHVHISNLKVQTANPNHWTLSSYWNIIGDQILFYFEIGYKVCWSNDFRTIQN